MYWQMQPAGQQQSAKTSVNHQMHEAVQQ
jgi:hypothetical protein